MGVKRKFEHVLPCFMPGPIGRFTTHSVRKLGWGLLVVPSSRARVIYANERGYTYREGRNLFLLPEIDYKNILENAIKNHHQKARKIIFLIKLIEDKTSQRASQR